LLAISKKITESLAMNARMRMYLRAIVNKYANPRKRYVLLAGKRAFERPLSQLAVRSVGDVHHVVREELISQEQCLLALFLASAHTKNQLSVFGDIHDDPLVAIIAEREEVDLYLAIALIEPACFLLGVPDAANYQAVGYTGSPYNKQWLIATTNEDMTFTKLVARLGAEPLAALPRTGGAASTQEWLLVLMAVGAIVSGTVLVRSYWSA
jgi:hypothetical protein